MITTRSLLLFGCTYGSDAGLLPLMWLMSDIELPFVLITVETRVNDPGPSPSIESLVSIGNLGEFSYFSAKVPMPMSSVVG